MATSWNVSESMYFSDLDRTTNITEIQTQQDFSLATFYFQSDNILIW